MPSSNTLRLTNVELAGQNLNSCKGFAFQPHPNPLLEEREFMLQKKGRGENPQPSTLKPLTFLRELPKILVGFYVQ